MRHRPHFEHGRGDRHLPESIDDRAGVNIVLTYPAEDEEATRIAVQALALLGRPLDRSDDAPSVAVQHPELHRRAVATQRLVAGLRDDWVERAIPRAPGLAHGGALSGPTSSSRSRPMAWRRPTRPGPASGRCASP